MAGPIGPPGFNGSQGPAGSSGAIGPPGPQGSGDFSACQYKVETNNLAPGNTKTLASKTEPDVSCRFFFRANILCFCVYFSLCQITPYNELKALGRELLLK